ncbi:MAG: ubiquinone/menaquinone biosynthesis methyltransferase [candidate division WOR-3 bacterium]
MNDGSPRMFSGIVRAYDRMNRLMSLGMDKAWRRLAARDCSGSVLDLCSGTGDMAISVKANGLSVIGLDGDMNMLRAMRLKAPHIPSVIADALCLPFRDGSFDSVTVAWGMRNLPDRRQALREIARVLRPGGRLIVLDSVLPENPAIRLLFRVYARFWIPFLARLLRTDPSAYSYFARSVEGFGPRGNFLKEMGEVGFEGARAIALSFGLIALFKGERP